MEARRQLEMRQRTAESPSQRSRTVLHTASTLALWSRMRLEEGSRDESLFLTRACVQLLKYAWISAEPVILCRGEKAKSMSPTSSIDDLVDKTSEMALSTHTPAQNSSRPIGFSRKIWSLASALTYALLELSRQLLDGGIYEYSIHYAEEARQVAEASGLFTILFKYHILRANISYTAKAHQEAQRYLDEAERFCKGLEHGRDTFNYYTILAKNQEALGLLHLASDTTRKLGLVLHRALTKNQQNRTSSNGSIERHGPKESRSRTTKEASKNAIEVVKQAVNHSFAIKNMERLVLKRKAEIALLENDLETVHDTLYAIQAEGATPDLRAWIQCMNLKWLAKRTMQNSAANPTINLLLEATLSLPVIASSDVERRKSAHHQVSWSPQHRSPLKTSQKAKKAKTDQWNCFVSALQESFSVWLELRRPLLSQCSLSSLRVNMLDLASAATLFTSLPSADNRHVNDINLVACMLGQ